MDLSKIGEPEIELLNEISNSKYPCKNLIKEKFWQACSYFWKTWQRVWWFGWICFYRKWRWCHSWEWTRGWPRKWKRWKSWKLKWYRLWKWRWGCPWRWRWGCPWKWRWENSWKWRRQQFWCCWSNWRWCRWEWQWVRNGRLEESTNKHIESHHLIIDNKSIMSVDLNSGQL